MPLGPQIDVRIFETFFDRRAVIDAMDKKRRKGLSKAGAFVMTGARSSIRQSKKTARPGQPPKSHTKKLKKGIFFGYDAPNESVAIGPIRRNDTKGKGKHLGALEGKFPFMGPALEREAPKFPEYIAHA